MEPELFTLSDGTELEVTLTDCPSGGTGVSIDCWVNDTASFGGADLTVHH